MFPARKGQTPVCAEKQVDIQWLQYNPSALKPCFCSELVVMSSRETDISGLWHGWYGYGPGGFTVPFTAWFQQSEHTVTGTTLEPNTFAHAGQSELPAEIKGDIWIGELSFRKIYLPSPGVHDTPIFYIGFISEDAHEINGDWRIDDPRGSGSGPFQLLRLRAASEKTKETSLAFDPDEITF